MSLCIIVVVVVIALMVLFVRHFRNPDGDYDYPGIGTEGFSYLHFDSGRVWLVTPESQRDMGSYFKSKGEWIWVSPSGIKCHLKASVTRLRIVEFDGKEVPPSPLKRIPFWPALKE